MSGDQSEIYWKERYAEKSIQCDQLIKQLCNEAAKQKNLCALMAKWNEESGKPVTFAPEEVTGEIDKNSRIRTSACANELAKIILGE